VNPVGHVVVHVRFWVVELGKSMNLPGQRTPFGLSKHRPKGFALPLIVTPASNCI